MTHHICPVCGCEIKDGGYKKDDITYCCEPCADGSSCECECGCHSPNPANIPDAGGE